MSLDEGDPDKFGNTLRKLEVESQTPVSAASHAGTAGMSLLPTELLVEIFSSLEPVQLNIARLVCKRWYFAILNQHTWARSFLLKLGTPTASFPSLSNSSNWMREYFARVHTLKKWRKGTPTHKFYPLINNDLRYVDTCVANFSSNDGNGRILTFSRRYGHVAMANTRNGKNQSFIPGASEDIIGFDINWNYLAYGSSRGGLYVRNLLTSTSTSTSRVSVKQFEPVELDDVPITCVCLNSNSDKYKQKCDVFSGKIDGTLYAHNLSGTLLGTLRVGSSPILHIKSDFKSIVIVCTDASLHFLDYASRSVLQSVDLGFNVEITPITFGNRAQSYTSLPDVAPPQLDVDFGGSNVIVSYRQNIVNFNFEDLDSIRKGTLMIPQGVSSTYCVLQTVNPSKTGTRNSRDKSLAGQDGLLYANALSDNTVIVWNVRDANTTIVPHCTIYPSLNKDLSEGIQLVASIALNSSIIAIGGYNGYTNIYNAFTGKLIRSGSVKFPRKFGLHDVLMPIQRIVLDTKQDSTCGIILCGDAVQYFQFGELEASKEQARRLNAGNLRKNKIKKQIHDGIEEYQAHVYTEEETAKRFDKYNGDIYDDEQDELAMAIALSESVKKCENEEDDLQLALRLSETNGFAAQDYALIGAMQDSTLQEDATQGYGVPGSLSSSSRLDHQNSEDNYEDDDDDIKRAIALSLLYR